MPEAVAATPVAAVPVVEPPKSAEDKLHERVAALLAKPAEVDLVIEPKVAEVSMDAETLAKLTEVSEKERAQRKRAEKAEQALKDRDSSAPDYAKFQEFQALWETDPTAAIAKFKQIEDPTAEMERVLKSWLKRDLPADKDKLTPEEIKALQDEAAAGKAFREGQEAQAKAHRDRESSAAFSAAQRDAKNEDGTARYPLASKPENAVEAAVVALEKATKRIIDLGGPQLTPQLAKHLFDLAYAEIEANLAKAGAGAPPVVVEPPSQNGRAKTIPKASTSPATTKTYERSPEGARTKLMDRVAELVAAGKLA